jgi:hypothetical protein
MGLIIGILLMVHLHKEGFNLQGVIILGLFMGIGNFIVMQALVDTITGVYRRKK